MRKEIGRDTSELWKVEVEAGISNGRSADQTRGNGFVQRRLIVCCSVRLFVKNVKFFIPTYLPTTLNTLS